MSKKILILGVLIIMSIGLFAGCGKDNKYNAVLYDDVRLWMQENFLKANMTYGSVYQYFDENGNMYTSEDTTSPKTRTLVISDLGTFNEAFISFLPNVDFDKEMLVLYIFTTTSINRRVLNSIEFTQQKLTIKFSVKKSQSNGDAIAGPGQMILVVKMDKIAVDATSIEFIKV